MEFSEIGIDSRLINALEKEDIIKPFPIQEAVIPEILKGISLAAKSETGSGKTLAFLLPLFEKIDLSVENCQVIILAPTHELAVQINDQARRLSENSGLPVRSQVIIGNVNMKRQIENLKKKPHIIVGSSGRINDLIKQKKIKCHQVKALVIDEADVMISAEGFDYIKSISGSVPGKRQMLFFSATISNAVMEKIKRFFPGTKQISEDSHPAVADTIDHIYFYVPEKRDKFVLIRKALHALNPGKCIIFVKTNTDAQDLVERLRYHDFNAVDLHSLNDKMERQRALESFRGDEAPLLVASDLAARGLDIKDVTHIFNFSIPRTAEEYLHRAGRTGRAGIRGTAVSITAGKEEAAVRNLGSELGISIGKKRITEGRVID